MRGDEGRTVSRRAAIGAIGVGAVAGIAVGSGVTASLTAGATPAPDTPTTPTVSPPHTVAAWAAVRGNTYFIAHRGSGDVYPEHSAEGYNAAVALGAQCIEVSVGMTSDGVVICMHDSTFDRTTNSTGQISTLPSTILRSVRLSAPQLGPAWAQDPVPQVPLFDDVLRELGGKVVMCIEAKDDAALEPVVQQVIRYGLTQSVISKVYFKSSSLQASKKAGLPVFAYFGSAGEVTAAALNSLAKSLDPATDYMVIPAFGTNSVTYLDDQLVRAAVATGVPVWVYPLHRRVDASHFFALGVQGAICSSYGYVSTDRPVAVSDTWKYKAIAAGEVTKEPNLAAFNLNWTGTDELSLQRVGGQHFVVLGDLCPIAEAKATYDINLAVSWTVSAAAPNAAFVLAFAHFDDAYYEFGSGRGNGYDAVVQKDGDMMITSHKTGTAAGVVLGKVTSDPVTQGEWIGFRLRVGPSTMTWSRLDAKGNPLPNQSVVVRDGSWRGGYVHVGRASADGILALRSLSVAKPVGG